MTAVDVEEAAERLVGVVETTPLHRNQRLSAAHGCEVLLKREDLQSVPSYKVRGAHNLILQLDDEARARGVVCASAGNHAQGFALACASLGVDGTVFVPTTTPRQKRERITILGGDRITLRVEGDTFDEASVAARAFAAEHGATIVHAFNDPRTIAGQGTVIAEAFAQLGRVPDAVVIPVGGGGLIAGAVAWLRERHPTVRIIGVEPPGVVWGLGVGWIGALGVPGTVNTPLSLPTVLGGWLDLVARVVELGTAPGTFLEFVRMLAQLGIVVVAAVVALRFDTGRGTAAVRAAAVVLGATVLLSPVVHLWYFLWVVPFLAVLPLPRRGMQALLAVSVLAGLVAPMDSSLHRAYLSIVVGSMLIAAVSVVLAVWHRVTDGQPPHVPGPRRAPADHQWWTEPSSEGPPHRRLPGMTGFDHLR